MSKIIKSHAATEGSTSHVSIIQILKTAVLTIIAFTVIGGAFVYLKHFDFKINFTSLAPLGTFLLIYLLLLIINIKLASSFGRDNIDELGVSYMFSSIILGVILLTVLFKKLYEYSLIKVISVALIGTLVFNLLIIIIVVVLFPAQFDEDKENAQYRRGLSDEEMETLHMDRNAEKASYIALIAYAFLLMLLLSIYGVI